MKLKHVVTGTVVLTALFLAGCGSQSGTGSEAPLHVATQFMDLYYKQGKLEEAKALAVPAVAKEIEAAFESAAGENGTGGEVSYMLKEKLSEGDHSFALYQLTITRKDAEPLYKTTSVFVDRVDGDWKITLFDEKKESGPHQEIH